nr:U-box domain-containing protein 35-like isoform X1 [Ipomoea batatas]
MAPQLPPDAAVGGSILTVVAVDKDKHSASAVKWAVDYLLVNNNITLILVHVRTKSSAHRTVDCSSPDANGGASDQDSQSVFTPFRAYSARKGVC